MMPLNLSLANAQTTSANPLSGVLGGGFAVSFNHQYGGKGNSISATQTPTSTLTPTLTAETGGSTATARTGPGNYSLPSLASPFTPYADGGFGYTGQAAPSSGIASNSFIMPAVILGAALLIGLALKK